MCWGLSDKVHFCAYTDSRNGADSEDSGITWTKMWMDSLAYRGFPYIDSKFDMDKCEWGQNCILIFTPLWWREWVLVK